MSSGRRSSAIAAVIGALVLALLAPIGLSLATPAAAQTDDTSTTSTSDTTSTTTGLTLPITTTTLPILDSTTTSTSSTTLPDGVPPQDPGQEQNDPVITPPSVDETVPPRDASDSGLGGPAQVVRIDLKGAQAKAQKLQATYEAAVAHRQDMETKVALLQAALLQMHTTSQQAVTELLWARQLMADRAANAYMRGGNNAEVLAGDQYADPVGYGSRVVLLGAVIERDMDAVTAFKAAKEKATKDEAGVAFDLAAAQSELDQARLDEGIAALGMQYAKVELAVTTAGGTLVIHGFVFPVASPHFLFNDFGDPRLPGTPNAHIHQGDDIAAAEGTAEFACERGVITSIGTSALGGNQVWLKGESGTSYYYTHLSAFADTLRLGQVVQAGDIIGLVGQTGDASGPHLHFEIHPDGGPAIDPYPVLFAADPLSKP